MRTTGLSVSMLGFTLAAAGCGQAYGVSSTSKAATEATACSPCTGPLPSAALAVPAGNELDFHLGAVGVQIYTCTATASGAAWAFTAPEANLYDGQGNLAATHYAGPTWESIDGSKVVGAKIAGAAPDPTAIPWLLLGAVSHGGSGRMEDVTFIHRLHTTGGIAPSSGCDATTIGAVARVPYTATYCFYEAP